MLRALTVRPWNALALHSMRAASKAFNPSSAMLLSKLRGPWQTYDPSYNNNNK
jgi:hypothetical protein